MQRVSPTEVVVEPRAGAPVNKERGLIEMTAAYHVKPTGEVAYNQILFELVQ